MCLIDNFNVLYERKVELGEQLMEFFIFIKGENRD